jgi:hypothetical protein
MKEELIRRANKICMCFLVGKHINLLKWQIRLKEWALEQIDRSASLQAIHSMKRNSYLLEEIKGKTHVFE